MIQSSSPQGSLTGTRRVLREKLRFRRRLRQFAFKFQRCELPETGVRADLVVLTPEQFDQDLRVGPVLKPMHVQTLVPELAVERFVHPVQPGFSRIDECGVDVTLCEPLQDRSGDEFGAIVAPEVSRCSMHADKPREYFDDTSRTDAAGYIDSQALARILVDDRQTLQLLAVAAGFEDKVVGP